jgi:hypothetical protein
VVHLPGEAFSKKLALDAWASAPRGGMISILVAIGLIEMISNRCPPRPGFCPRTRPSQKACAPESIQRRARWTVHGAWALQQPPPAGEAGKRRVLSRVYSSSTAAHAPRLGSDTLRAGSFAMTPVDMFGNPNRQVQPQRCPRVAAPRGSLTHVRSEGAAAAGHGSHSHSSAPAALRARAPQPGNLGFDPLSLGSNAAVRAKYELAEVTHGRAAMMGFSGVIHQVQGPCPPPRPEPPGDPRPAAASPLL